MEDVCVFFTNSNISLREPSHVSFYFHWKTIVQSVFLFKSKLERGIDHQDKIKAVVIIEALKSNCLFASKLLIWCEYVFITVALALLLYFLCSLGLLLLPNINSVITFDLNYLKG